MQLPETLTDAQHAALVACLRILAEIGEDGESEQKAKLALPVGEPAASLAETHGTFSFAGVSTDA